MKGSAVGRRMEENIVLIGIGNAVRGDDAAGLEVAERLRGRVPPGVRVVVHDGEPAGLIERWHEARAVVLVDAVVSGAPAGTVRRFEAHAEPLPAAAFGPSTHAMGIAEAVELARALGDLPDVAVVYGLEGEAFEPGAAMSEAVGRAIDDVAGRVLAELEALALERPGGRARA